MLDTNFFSFKKKVGLTQGGGYMTFKTFLKILVCLHIRNLGVAIPEKVAYKFTKILI